MNFNFRIFTILLVSLFTSCDFPDMETVPSAETIRSWDALQPFLVAEKGITGIYQNFDVDSLIFHYSTSYKDERNLLEAIRGNIKETRWGEASDDTCPYYQFERRFEKGEENPNRPGMSLCPSTEILRITFFQDRDIVVVGYLQSDGGSELQWSERFLWPQYNRQIDKLKNVEETSLQQIGEAPQSYQPEVGG